MASRDVSDVRPEELRFLPRNFVRAYLLLLIRESPDHGYGLVMRLARMGVTDAGPGSIYRALRSLEGAGLVVSRWVDSQAGPRKRVYVMTQAGQLTLDSWTRALHEASTVLTTYLGRYERCVACMTGSAAG